MIAACNFKSTRGDSHRRYVMSGGGVGGDGGVTGGKVGDGGGVGGEESVDTSQNKFVN